jgi:heme-degrading monooxygenase HmoA
MKVKILSKLIVPEDMAEKTIPVLQELMMLVTKQTGYVFGEILRSRGKPTEWLFITTWLSFRDWECWLESHERRELVKKLDYLEEGSIEVYDYGFLR